MTDDPVLEALRAQCDELAGLLDPLGGGDWDRPSGCDGWSIADVVLHLAQTNEMATASAGGRLAERASSVWTGGGTGGGAASDVDALADAAVASERGATGPEVFERWRRSADDLVAALAAIGPATRVEWVAGDMSARTLATTRIAEGWIHTGDVAGGLGVDLAPSDRLWHIARLAHRTLPYAFLRDGRDQPGPVAFVLEPPDGGEPWTFGDPDTAATIVHGSAHDLCRVAGQRAAAADTGLRASGPDADAALELVRTFA